MFTSMAHHHYRGFANKVMVRANDKLAGVTSDFYPSQLSDIATLPVLYNSEDCLVLDTDYWDDGQLQLTSLYEVTCMMLTILVDECWLLGGYVAYFECKWRVCNLNEWITKGICLWGKEQGLRFTTSFANSWYSDSRLPLFSRRYAELQFCKLIWAI
jgi:hypothetical protein